MREGRELMGQLLRLLQQQQAPETEKPLLEIEPWLELPVEKFCFEVVSEL